jgi:hypothetical protein
MAIDWALPASFVITGKIEPAPPPDDGGEPLRIHIHHLNPWSDLDVKIDEDGRFRIYDYPSGACVLSVIRGPKVIHVQAVYFAQRSHSTSFILRIGDTATPMLRVE